MAVLSHLVNRLARVALLLAVVSAMPARARMCRWPIRSSGSEHLCGMWVR